MNFIQQHIELVKIATDVFLILALTFLGVRIYRSPRAAASLRKVGQLEGTLRSLVKDAEMASRSLNDQLLKRQQDLEKLLGEIGASEERVHRVLSSVDEKRSTLDAQIALAKRSIEQLSAEQSKRDVLAAAARLGELSQPPLEGRIVEAAPIVEPKSFITGGAALTPPARRASTNIYGEPLPATSTPPSTKTAQPVKKATQRYMQSLARKVEREVSAPPPPIAQDASSAMATLEEVYDAAERLLRSGKELEFVAQATNLPLEEVQALARLAGRMSSPSPVVTEQTVAAPPVGEDPRLGVLGGGIKRQVQVL